MPKSAEEGRFIVNLHALVEKAKGKVSDTDIAEILEQKAKLCRLAQIGETLGDLRLAEPGKSVVISRDNGLA